MRIILLSPPGKDSCHAIDEATLPYVTIFSGRLVSFHVTLTHQKSANGHLTIHQHCINRATPVYSNFASDNSPLTILYHAIDSCGPVWITQDQRYRYLSFTPPGQSTQTSMDLLFPQKITFGYQKMILAGLMTLPTSPKSLCIIGLGGGALTAAISTLFPQCSICNVELNPDMLSYAQDFFHFKQTPMMSLHVQDGAQFLANLPESTLFDAIIIDAFGENYIPEAFLKLQFVKSLYKHLSVHGIVLVNTFISAPSHDQEALIYTKVFKTAFSLTPLFISEGNRVIFASKSNALIIPVARAVKNARSLTAPLAPIGLTPEQVQKILSQ